MKLKIVEFMSRRSRVCGWRSTYKHNRKNLLLEFQLVLLSFVFVDDVAQFLLNFVHFFFALSQAQLLLNFNNFHVDLVVATVFERILTIGAWIGIWIIDSFGILLDLASVIAVFLAILIGLV